MSQMTDTGRIRPITGRPSGLEPPHVDQEILQRVTGLINLGVTFLNSLICMRFLLEMLSANPANPFARFIYSATEPFLSVFHGLTRALAFRGVAFELSLLIAITVYSLLGWCAIQLLRTLFGRAE